MSTPRWLVVANQCIEHGGELVAMARSPQVAQEIVAGMSAQDVGEVAVNAVFEQRLADIREEFAKQLFAAVKRTERAEVQLKEIQGSAQ